VDKQLFPARNPKKLKKRRHADELFFHLVNLTTELSREKRKAHLMVFKPFSFKLFYGDWHGTVVPYGTVKSDFFVTVD
jgi:hypothetical protein